MKINFKIAARRTKMIFKPKMTNDAEMITKRLQLAIKLVKVAKIWLVSQIFVRNTIRETGEDEAEEYDIVGRTEADAFNGKISDESPVGHALMGKAVGEKVEVLLPTGQTVECPLVWLTSRPRSIILSSLLPILAGTP